MGKSSLASVDNVFKNTTALVPKPSTELSTKSPKVVKTIEKWLTPVKMGHPLYSVLVHVLVLAKFLFSSKTTHTKPSILYL